MSEEKVIRMIKFSGKHQDWDEHKGYRKLLLCKKIIPGEDVVPKESEYEAAEAE
jgi:hypothetical protein